MKPGLSHSRPLYKRGRPWAGHIADNWFIIPTPDAEEYLEWKKHRNLEDWHVRLIRDLMALPAQP